MHIVIKSSYYGGKGRKVNECLRPLTYPAHIPTGDNHAIPACSTTTTKSRSANQREHRVRRRTGEDGSQMPPPLAHPPPRSSSRCFPSSTLLSRPGRPRASSAPPTATSATTSAPLTDSRWVMVRDFHTTTPETSMETCSRCKERWFQYEVRHTGLLARGLSSLPHQG
ncbi:ATP-dependent DNA helicase PIF1 [Penicillium sp. DV-2018c]|nr:ATP-dependent DNA helicase PIF1 [Penicillium sp. DV-2018c]